MRKCRRFGRLSEKALELWKCSSHHRHPVNLNEKEWKLCYKMSTFCAGIRGHVIKSSLPTFAHFVFFPNIQSSWPLTLLQNLDTSKELGKVIIDKISLRHLQPRSTRKYGWISSSPELESFFSQNISKVFFFFRRLLMFLQQFSTVQAETLIDITDV